MCSFVGNEISSIHKLLTYFARDGQDRSDPLFVEHFWVAGSLLIAEKQPASFQLVGRYDN